MRSIRGEPIEGCRSSASAGMIKVYCESPEDAREADRRMKKLEDRAVGWKVQFDVEREIDRWKTEGNRETIPLRMEDVSPALFIVGHQMTKHIAKDWAKNPFKENKEIKEE